MTAKPSQQADLGAQLPSSNCGLPVQTPNGHSRPGVVSCCAILLIAVFLLDGCATTQKPFPMTEVAPGIFQGYKPRSQHDFDQLHQHGIRTILSLQALPGDIYPEHVMALKNHISYKSVPIPATPFPPDETRVRAALQVLSDRSLHPIFIHCLLGRDRAAMVVGLYHIYYEGWPPEAAWREMRRRGFSQSWSLRGFQTYFWAHTSRPAWVDPGQRLHTKAGPLSQ